MKVYAAILICLGTYLLVAFAVNGLRTGAKFIDLEMELRELDSMGSSSEEFERVDRELSDEFIREVWKNRWLLGLGLTAFLAGIAAIILREHREKKRYNHPINSPEPV